MEEKFREYGIKITPQRLELIKKLKELEKYHPSFNDVYMAVKATHPNVSRSTIHENLKLLLELDIIRSFHYKGENRYEMNSEPNINLAGSDGKIIDIENDKIKKYLVEIGRILNEEEEIKYKTIMVIVKEKK
ncbi:MAG: transcriptional repressor [Methanobacterium sp.]|nr:transcriptional repressor [Methanobacterium sp.]